MAAVANTAVAQNADSVEAQAVTMRWSTPLDGSSSVDKLAFVARNTTARPIDVQIDVSTYDGVQQTASAPSALQVPANTSLSLEVSVADLRLSDWPVATQVSARYQGSDGLSHRSGMETVWVRATSDVLRATVRSAANESRVNMSTLPGLRRADESLIKAVASAAHQSATGQGSSVGRTLLTGRPSLSPYSSASAKAGHVAASGNSLLASPYVFCFTMPYVYFDENLGEDMLTAGTDVQEGQSPASFMHFVLTDQANTGSLVNVFLDANGCSGQVQLEDGQYIAWVTTELHDEANRSTINIRSTQGAEFVWYTRGVVEQGGDNPVISMSGASAASNAGVAAALAMQRLGSAFTGRTIEVLTDVNCPGDQFPFSACAIGTNTFYGSNADGVPTTFYKNIVLHELGHQVQSNWLGSIGNDGYQMDPGLPLSGMCEQVMNTNKAHCLQSRHKSTAGQVEGFGHFFASDALNRGEENDCTFGYYKAFQEDDGTVSPPPTARTCAAPVRWMETHCNENSADRGTEYDWLGFYWNVKNKTAEAFSYADLGAVYAQACGGQACAGQAVAWSALVNGANTVYGVSAPKAVYWSSAGQTFGVAH